MPVGLFSWSPKDSSTGAPSGGWTSMDLSMVRADAAGKNSLKDELRSLPCLYFGPFIGSFQLQLLLKIVKPGANIWREFFQRLEPAQLCLEFPPRGHPRQSRNGRWSFPKPLLPEVGDLGKVHPGFSHSPSFNLEPQWCTFPSNSYPWLFRQINGCGAKHR